MSTVLTYRNEAAGRMRAWLRAVVPSAIRVDTGLERLADALTSERRATVKRIRLEIRLSAFHANNPQLTKGWEELYRILDQEEAR